jgi:hypothetical protein
VPSARVLPIPAIADLLATLAVASPSPRAAARQFGAESEHRP